MSNWQIGDLALCVIGGKLPSNSPEGDTPKKGAVYRVRHVWPSHYTPNGEDALYLEDCPLNNFGRPVFMALRFRKIKPDTEPCEEEFTALLKLSKKRSVKA